MYDLDIIIPVYNEAENILPVFDSLKKYVKTRSRILICYDRDDDNTLPVVRSIANFPFEIDLNSQIIKLKFGSGMENLTLIVQK